MTEARNQVSRKKRFWATWQSFVAIPATLFIGWMLLAPEDLWLAWELVFLVWLAIFALGAIAALIRLRLMPDR